MLCWRPRPPQSEAERVGAFAMSSGWWEACSPVQAAVPITRLPAMHGDPVGVIAHHARPLRLGGGMCVVEGDPTLNHQHGRSQMTLSATPQLRKVDTLRVFITWCLDDVVFTREYHEVGTATRDFADKLATAIDPKPDQRRHINEVVLVAYDEQDQPVLRVVSGTFDCEHTNERKDA